MAEVDRPAGRSSTRSSGTSSSAPARPSSARAEREERSQRTRELLLEAQQADPVRREELLQEVVLINRSVAEAVAGRYRHRGVPQEDLEQAAFEGLVKAVRKFDPRVRPDLLTYAVPTVRGEVQRYFRDRSWMVRPPRRIQELQWQIGHGIDTLSQELGREPTAGELSEEVGCSNADLREALQAFGAFRPSSLERPVGSGRTTVGETIAEDDQDLGALEARLVLGPALRQLSRRDRRILYMRFFEERSQHEIGEQLGVTQMQVSRLLTRILRDLRGQITSGGPPAARSRGRGR